MYAIRSELTRRRWQILEDMRDKVRSLATARFDQAWLDGDRQLEWCRYWLRAGQRLASPESLRVVCGAGTFSAVIEKLTEISSDYPGRIDFCTDDTLPPGLTIEWTDHELDGSLRTQRDALVEAVLRRVAGILIEDRSGVQDG